MVFKVDVENAGYMLDFITLLLHTGAQSIELSRT